ncbi:MAG: hypothetical protein NTY68_04030 [Candidatus Micrarchaeota archaeon]|nr:hypothetical protein [Candidatus Micrarchaeota archaeon]
MDSTNNNTLIIAGIGIIFLLLGLGIGYVMFSAPASAAANSTVTATSIVVDSGNFSVDNTKLNAQIAAMNKFYNLIGQQVNLKVNTAKVGPEGLIEVNVSNSGDNTTALLYFTKTYKFVSTAPIDVINYTAEAEVQINAQKAAEAAANSTNGTNKTTAPAATAAKTDKPKVELYVMAFCPYGNQAEQGLYPVIKAFNSTFDFEPVYIISGSAGNWRSLHGASELNQDIREKIVYNLYGIQVWNEYVNNVNTKCTVQTVDACWKDAVQNISIINISAVEGLYNSSFDALAKEMSDKTSSKKISGSPTMLINGATYSGGRTADAFKAGICNAFTTQPSQCNLTFSATAAATSGSCG